MAQTSSDGFRPAGKEEAIASLKAFVMSVGVTDPADTEEALLIQAAPFMTESLEHNLQKNWTEEERRRLDKAPEPAAFDHTNRDHEYLFFKKMRSSLERRMSTSSHGSPRGKRGSIDSVSSNKRSRSASLDKQPLRGSFLFMARPTSTPNMAAPEDRCGQRRQLLDTVWTPEGRAILNAIDKLPEPDFNEEHETADTSSQPASPQNTSSVHVQAVDGADHKRDHHKRWQPWRWFGRGNGPDHSEQRIQD